MITDVDTKFSLDKKASEDGVNKKVQEWEDLMWKYQKSLPISKKGEKWILIKQIYC
jgi:L-rhamnose mutarotase